MKLIIIGIFSLFIISCSDTSNSLRPLDQADPILAFGDSLTFGYGAKSDQSYPSQLSKLLGIEVINQGVNGETSSEGLSRLSALLDKYQPQLLLLCHGANDMLKKQNLNKMKANLAEMITMAQEREVQVVLIAVPEANIFLSEIPQYKALSTQFGIPLESNIIEQVVKEPSLRSDLIHPNAQGYRLIAEAIYHLLQSNGAVE